MGTPQQLRPSAVQFTADDARRALALVDRYGSKRAAVAALGTSEVTFDAMRSRGRTRTDTRERLLEALERAEAAPCAVELADRVRVLEEQVRSLQLAAPKGIPE